jgi:hypothetical protein
VNGGKMGFASQATIDAFPSEVATVTHAHFVAV